MTKETEYEITNKMYIIVSYAADEALKLLKANKVKEAQIILEKGLYAAEKLIMSEINKE